MERNAYRSSWPGFVPAIHVLASQTDRKDVDARHKAGVVKQKINLFHVYKNVPPLPLTPCL
jgi:hypothetical protein